MLYLGWIPTVSGSLSFDLIAREGYIFPFFILKGDDGYPTLIYQKRIPPDVKIINVFPLSKRINLIISSKLLKIFKKESFLENYFCYMYTKNKIHPIKIYGLVLIFAKMEKNELDEIKENLSSCINADEIIKYANFYKRKVFIFKFLLRRDGLILIKNENNGSKEIDEECELAYRFIKEIFHIHKHHDYSEDNILPLIKLKKYRNNWHIEISRRLLRYIIRNRENKGCDTLGMIAYLKTFKEIFNKRFKNKGNFSGFKMLENLEKSIQYKINSENNKTSSNRWLYGSIMAILFFWISAHEELLKNELFINSFSFSVILFTIFSWKKILLKDIIISIYSDIIYFLLILSNSYTFFTRELIGMILIILSIIILFLSYMMF